jgi:hypothetical protein
MGTHEELVWDNYNPLHGTMIVEQLTAIRGGLRHHDACKSVINWGGPQCPTTSQRMFRESDDQWHASGPPTDLVRDRSPRSRLMHDAHHHDIDTGRSAFILI